MKIEIIESFLGSWYLCSQRTHISPSFNCNNHHHPAGRNVYWLLRKLYCSCRHWCRWRHLRVPFLWGNWPPYIHTDMAASLWRRRVTCHAHGHANIRDLQPHCGYPHTAYDTNVTYSVEFHKLYITPSLYSTLFHTLLYIRIFETFANFIAETTI